MSTGGTFYTGNSPDIVASQFDGSRFFYALHIDDDYFLYLTKVDMLFDSTSTIRLNEPGPDSTKDFTDFEWGVDFFDKRLTNKEDDPDIVNLKYEQYRWDSKDIEYYVNSEGEFILKINSVAG